MCANIEQMRRIKKTVLVNNPMQKKYSYELIAQPGKDFDKEFKPDLTPKEMLELGVFGGLYLNSARGEYPKEWFRKAKLSKVKDPKINFFGVDASQDLSEWKKKGWISKYDPRGWFEWYCRYFMGRRIPDEDQKQIKRWKAICRHCAQVANNCRLGDMFCRTRQRQALLHWSYDSRKL